MIQYIDALRLEKRLKTVSVAAHKGRRGLSRRVHKMGKRGEKRFLARKLVLLDIEVSPENAYFQSKFYAS
jgi:hypothetical protein